MIVKIEEQKNGYILDDFTTSDEFGKVLKSYTKVRCVICNEKTASVIKQKFLSKMWFKKPSVTPRLVTSFF